MSAEWSVLPAHVGRRVSGYAYHRGIALQTSYVTFAAIHERIQTTITLTTSCVTDFGDNWRCEEQNKKKMIKALMVV